MSSNQLPPSAAAVLWMLTALGDRARQYGVTELQHMSLMHGSTFWRGLATLKARGLVAEDGNAIRLLLKPGEKTAEKPG